ncbi:RICIN domain-containing protein [Actinophytocola sp.]|uniref:RICIN domain-containing protein n=1 Tax=Actinophytocola sp. TaxID=1872138 RepID=UPI002ED30BD3
MFLAIITMFALASPAGAIDTGFQYEINPRHNFGKCLDVRGSSTADNAHVIQYDCHGGLNQRFTFVRVFGSFYEIRPVHSSFAGKCLDIADAGTANHAILQQFDCNGRGNQLFQLLDDPGDFAGGSTRIRAVHSTKCLDIPDASNANSVIVAQFDCHGGSNQLFDLLAFA